MAQSRHIVQNTGFVCRGIRHSLHGPVMELGFLVQLHHEAVLHRQLLLHPLSHESQVSVRPLSPRRMCQTVAKPRLLDQLMTPPLIHSKSNTSSGPACFSVSSSTTSSCLVKSSGHSPSSSRPSLFSHNYSCCKGQERRKPSRPITLPLWERTGLSTFRTGYIGTCGGHSRRPVLTLKNSSIF